MPATSCTGTTRTGDPCRNPVIPGDDRCRLHRRMTIDGAALGKLIAFLRAGNYLDVALAAAGIDLDELTDELRAQIDSARAEGEALAIARINQAASDNWQAAAWLLERQYPERWARPATRPSEDSAPPLVVPTDGLDELAGKRARRRAGVPR